MSLEKRREREGWERNLGPKIPRKIFRPSNPSCHIFLPPRFTLPPSPPSMVAVQKEEKENLLLFCFRIYRGSPSSSLSHFLTMIFWTGRKVRKVTLLFFLSFSLPHLSFPPPPISIHFFFFLFLIPFLCPFSAALSKIAQVQWVRE